MLNILAYHKVNCIETDPLTVNTETFLRELDYLDDKGFNFIVPAGILLKTDDKRNIVLTFDDGYKDNYETVFPLLKAKGIPAVFFVTYNSLGEDGMLSREEVKSISDHGFIIGSHTLSHSRLTALSLDDARKEIAESKRRLEELLKREIEYFSYPYGEINEDIVNLVKEAGYKAGFVTPARWNIKIKKGLFAIRRCGIYHKDIFPVFTFKLSPLYKALRLN